MVLVVLASLFACKPGDPGRSTGSYPIDIYQEMHYNQTHKAQEPPRLLPAEGSVPVSGGSQVIPAAKADAKGLANPFPSTEENLDQAARLYHVNCAMCHGQTARGDGVVGSKFTEYGAPAPPAFGGDRIQALSSGEVYWSLSNGFGYMPPFGSLLKDEDRWALVNLVDLSDPQRDKYLIRDENQAPGGS